MREVSNFLKVAQIINGRTTEIELVPWHFKKIFNFFIGCVGSLLLCAGFLQLRQVRATLHCGAWTSHCGGFSCCGAWALGAQAQQLWHVGPRACRLQQLVWQAQQLWLAGSRAQAQQLWCMGLDAPWHVGSSRTRDQTRVPCVGRRILNHCTTREVPRPIAFCCVLFCFYPGIIGTQTSCTYLMYIS